MKQLLKLLFFVGMSSCFEESGYWSVFIAENGKLVQILAEMDSKKVQEAEHGLEHGHFQYNCHRFRIS